MSDTKPSNRLLECPSCKQKFLNRDYSKHINKEHESEIFVDKNNKKELEDLANKKDGRFFRPLELKVHEKTLYYVPCCKKYYSKFETAKTHTKKKECTDTVLQEAKNLLEKIVINTPINIDISGNNNTANVNVTNNFNFYDVSGNLIKKIVKELTTTIDVKERDMAEMKKKLKKLQSIFSEDERYDSDISSVQSGYDSDSESDAPITAKKFDTTKELPKKIVKQLDEAKIDLSRKGLGLKTKEQKEAQQEEQKKKQEAQEAFDKEIKEYERLNRIGILKSEIISLKEQIKKREQLHKERLELMKEENSGITQEVFDAEWSQTSKIIALKKSLMDAQSEMCKLTK
jgi:uncharacterized C2H2 Zn-finger protein